MSPVFFFVLAMFFLAAALTRSGLDRRFALSLLVRAGTDPRRVLLALMAGTARAFLDPVRRGRVRHLHGGGPRHLRQGRREAGLVVRARGHDGDPIASLIGGVATPAGSAINVLGLFFIEEVGKVACPSCPGPRSACPWCWC
jgi:sodium-dependent dicarboxylate transporter 2/3/5